MATWSTKAFLLLHPVPRQLQQIIIQFMYRFLYFIGLNHIEPWRITLDLQYASDIAVDLFYTNHRQTAEVGRLLKLFGSEYDKIAKSSMVNTDFANLRLSNDIETVATELQNALRDLNASRDSVAQDTAQAQISRSTAIGKRKRRLSAAHDIVTQGLIPKTQRVVKVCTACGGVSANDMQAGDRTSSWEAARRLSCICGHPWFAQIV
ncbi:hypothetical protein EMMF5_005073 [Cystobasidiomycetes sp. EMM_F5]